MSYKHNIIKERLDINITLEGEVKKGEFQLDSNADVVYGIALTSNFEELLYYRGSQKIQVNDQELFPENFESKLLMSGLSVAPNQRVVKVGLVESGNGKVEVWYKDTESDKASFEAYTVSIYIFSKVKP